MFKLLSALALIDLMKSTFLQYLCLWPEQQQESEILSEKDFICCNFNTCIHISLLSMHIKEWQKYNTKTLMPANPILKWRLCTEEWVSDCGLTPSEQLFRYIMAGTSYIQWHVDGDNLRLVLEQHAYLILCDYLVENQQMTIS